MNSRDRKNPAPISPSTELRVRTVRLATGAYFVSFVRDDVSDRRCLAEELEQLAGAEDLVLNLDGLDPQEAIGVSTAAATFSRRTDPGLVTLVCERADVLEALRTADIGAVRVERSLDRAFHRALGHAWLKFLLPTPDEPAL
jgi:hypothetical protein